MADNYLDQYIPMFAITRNACSRGKVLYLLWSNMCWGSLAIGHKVVEGYCLPIDVKMFCQKISERLNKKINIYRNINDRRGTINVEN